MTDDSADGVRSASAGTWVFALLIDASEMSWALAVANTLRPTTGWDSREAWQTGARWTLA